MIRGAGTYVSDNTGGAPVQLMTVADLFLTVRGFRDAIELPDDAAGGPLPPPFFRLPDALPEKKARRKAARPKVASPTRRARPALGEDV